MDYSSYFISRLNDYKKNGNYRYLLHLEKFVGELPYAFQHTGQGTEKILIWCNNDYCGMSQHPDVLKAMRDSIKLHGAGSGGSRSISGTDISHIKLERLLAKLHHKPSALLFSTGYIANEAVISTLGSQLGFTFFSDQENHASIIQGITKSKQEKYIFNHCDVDHLEFCLKKCDINKPKIIVFESIYSMSGQVAPLKEICALAKKYKALTYLDEVHAVGAYGPTGAGIAEELGVSGEIDIIQSGFGKTVGVMGGYIAGSEELVDFVRTFAPGFIFTTSMLPCMAEGSYASLTHMMTSSRERDVLHKNVRYLKAKLQEEHISFLDGGGHIIPVVVGNAIKCKQLTDYLLQEHKIYIQPIVYPTVPVGQERIRLTPTCNHTFEMIEDLVGALKSFWVDNSVPLAA